MYRNRKNLYRLLYLFKYPFLIKKKKKKERKKNYDAKIQFVRIGLINERRKFKESDQEYKVLHVNHTWTLSENEKVHKILINK